jgi:hypothetical protein
MNRPLITVLLLSFSLFLAVRGDAAFHLWDINEIYSNASGSVQFIELFTTADSQQFTNGRTIQTGQNTFTFPSNTPAPTGNRHLLLATAGFFDVAGVTPDFTLANNFFAPSGDTINFLGADSVTFASVPIDGVRSLGFPGATVMLNSPTNYAGNEGFVRPTGDFDDNGVFAVDDIDLLVSQIVSGANDPAFDLDVNGSVNEDDLTLWRTIAGNAQLPSMSPYLIGDANLDGTVDGQDFVDWNAHKFTADAAWSHGDFDASGFVDGQDFISWNANKFQSADHVFVVPEPVIWSGLALTLLFSRWLFVRSGLLITR